MKRSIQLIFLIIICHSSFSQKNDYVLLKTVLNDFKKFKPNDSIRIYEKSLEFKIHDEFFTENFLANYSHPTIGVDTAKIITLINEMDFAYLRKHKRINDDWNEYKLPENIILYAENSRKELNEKRQYKIAKPVYSEDEQTAFVYYYAMCGYMDCSSFNVRVYKKIKGKWVFYVYIPITVS